MKHRKNVYGKTARLSRIQARAWSAGPPNQVNQRKNVTLPPSKQPHWKKNTPFHIKPKWQLPKWGLHWRVQNSIIADSVPYPLGGGGDVTFLKLSADQLIISIDCHLIFVCRNLLCLQWLEIYCFKYQVFNRSAPLQCYYYLACFIELFSVQLHFCCPAHFYSETSLGRELNLIFAFLWSSPTTPPCCRTAPANL